MSPSVLLVWSSFNNSVRNNNSKTSGPQGAEEGIENLLLEDSPVRPESTSNLVHQSLRSTEVEERSAARSQDREEERQAGVPWSCFLIHLLLLHQLLLPFLLLLLPEELKIDHSSKDAQLHQDDDG